MERKSSLLYLGLLAIALTGGLHFIAGEFYLYWTVGWFDYSVHFLGGLGGGLVATWYILGVGEETFRPRAWVVSLSVFFAVMVMGVGWEVFEYINNLTQSTEGYVLDTAHDLVMDAVGALTAVWFGITRTKDNINVD